MLLVAATPLFFRFPQTFYPEALETALFGLETGLVIIAIRSPTVGRGIVILLGAGLFGGIGLVLRATSAVVPLVLAFFIFCEVGRRPKSALIFISSLAAGYAIPLLAEGLYYYILTGDPIYRYIVDSKDGFVSEEMVGKNFTGRDALFDFDLARRWDRWAPSVFRVHWTVNHLVNLFSTPSLLLTPYLGLVGMIFALRSKQTRSFALFALFLLALQYATYTFVFSLSPTPRYYSTSVFLFCIFGGLLLANLTSSIQRSGLLSIQVGIALLVGLTQISPEHIVKTLVIDGKKLSPLYVSSRTAAAAYLILERDASLGESVRVGFPPIGGLALIGWDGWPPDTLKRTCDDGTPRWGVIETSTHPSVPWRVISSLYPNAASALPDRIGSYLRRDAENTALAQRRC